MSRENQTPAEQAMYAERQRARWRKKNAQRREKRRAAKAATVDAVIVSKTCPTFRRKLPKAPEMSKAELRRFLAQAVQNTGGAPA